MIQPKPALICRAKNREKHSNFDGACSMKPPVASQRKSEPGLEIVQRYCDRSSLAFATEAFQFLT